MEKNWDRLDFVLGSVHFLEGDWAFDHAGEEAEFARRDIDRVYADYYERIRKMRESGLVDCMAHLDLVKIFGFRPTQNSMSCSTRSFLKFAKSISRSSYRPPAGANQ